MTAHIKMFKKIDCTQLGKLGDGQGGMRVSDYGRRAVRLTKTVPRLISCLLKIQFFHSGALK